MQPLRLHYVRTLDTWAANLESKTDEAIAVTSPAVYARYMKYLTGCADLFRDGAHGCVPIHLREKLIHLYRTRIDAPSPPIADAVNPRVTVA